MIAYLDNSATTPLCSGAKEKIIYACDECWGNPSSLHEKGIEAEMLLTAARRAVAKALSADEKEIFFTSGGTEANNLAVLGAAHALKRKGRRVITTAIEHPSVSKAFARLESEGFEVIRIGTDRFGNVDMAAMEAAINDDTILVSMMAVNNEVGTIQPFESLRSIVKRKGAPALIHIDAVQAFGKIPLNVKKIGADLMTVSSHKIHGPKGVGALFIRNGVKLTPNALGGEQEKEIRPGTEPMIAVAGFLGAVEELKINDSLKKVQKLRDDFVRELKSIEGLGFNSPENALPYIVNISLEGLPAETVLNLLSDMGIYVSSGSACAKGHKSPVLTAMGLDDKIINSSLRISLSRMTTADELHACAEGIRKATEVIMRKK